MSLAIYFFQLISLSPIRNFCTLDIPLVFAAVADTTDGRTLYRVGLASSCEFFYYDVGVKSITILFAPALDGGGLEALGGRHRSPGRWAGEVNVLLHFPL